MRRDRIRLVAAAIAGIVVLVGVGTHFLLPPYLAGRVEGRLQEHGGRADVTLRAVPALRLLAGHGDHIQIEGSGLEYEFDDPDRNAFERLDGFDEVDIDLTDVTAGPFVTESFHLRRDEGSERYQIEADAIATAQELARIAGEQFGELGGLIGTIGGGALPFSNVPVPIHLAGELESNDGKVEMVSGSGDVAGIPAGPLTQLITNAVLSRL